MMVLPFTTFLFIYSMMAPEAEIYDYRVFGPVGMGVNEAITTAIGEAVEDGCDIINMSLGGPVPDLVMHRAMKAAHKAGVILVVAAGNGGDNDIYTTENSWPANFKQAISVAALSKRDNLPVAYFSNTNSQVDYAGIGVDVTSFRPDGTYQQMSGTSMACPHVCGFITALMTKGGAYSDIIQDDASCRALLNEKFCIDIAVEGKDNATGLGFLTYLSKEEFEKGFLDLPDFSPPELPNKPFCGICI
jgi:subtilisin